MRESEFGPEITGLNDFYSYRLEEEGFEDLKFLLDPAETVEFFRVLGNDAIPKLKSSVSGLVERFSGVKAMMGVVQPNQLFGIYGRSAENSKKLALTETGEILRKFLLKNGEQYRLCVVHGLAMQAENFRPEERRRFFPNENEFSPTAITVAQQMDKDPYGLRRLRKTTKTEDEYHFSPPEGDIDLCVFTSDPDASFEKLAALLREAAEGVPFAVVVVESIRQPGFKRVQIETQGISLPPLPEEIDVRDPEAFRTWQEKKTKIQLVHIVSPRDIYGNFRMGLSLPYLIMSGGTVPNLIDLVPYPDGRNIIGFSYDFFNLGPKLQPEIEYYQPSFAVNPPLYKDYEKPHLDVEKFVFYPWPEIAFPCLNFPQRYYDALYGFRGVWPFGYTPILGNPFSMGESLSSNQALELARQTAGWFYENVWWPASVRPRLLGESFEQRKSNAEKTFDAVIKALEVNPHSSAVRYLLKPGETDSDNPNAPFFGMGIASAIHPNLDGFLDEDSRRRILTQMWADSAWQVHTAGKCNICRYVEAFRQGFLRGEEDPFGNGFIDFNGILEEKVGLYNPKLQREEIIERRKLLNRMFTAKFV